MRNLWGVCGSVSAPHARQGKRGPMGPPLSATSPTSKSPPPGTISCNLQCIKTMLIIERYQSDECGLTNLHCFTPASAYRAGQGPRGQSLTRNRPVFCPARPSPTRYGLERDVWPSI